MGSKGIEANQAQSSTVSKRKRRRVESFSIYIYKVLKQVHRDLTISKKAMKIVNSFVYDIFDTIALEAAKLVKLNKSKTLNIRDIRSAIKLILHGDIRRFAVNEANRVTAFRFEKKPKNYDNHC